MFEKYDPVRGKIQDYNKVLKEKAKEADFQNKIDSLLEQINQCINEIHKLEGMLDNSMDLLDDDNSNREQDRINHHNINRNIFEQKLEEKKVTLEFLKNELTKLTYIPV